MTKNILDFMMTKFKTYDLFKLCGIQIKFNISFLLIGVLVFLGTWKIGVAVATVVTLTVSLLAHELGHCLVAKKYGYMTHDISMTVLGGCASIDIASSGKIFSPDEELNVSIAGPCVSFVLGIGSLVCLVVLLCIASTANFVAVMLHPMMTVFSLMTMINIILGLFNLIPAFPMDGGRCFRAWLQKSWKKSRIEATELAIKIAKVIACIFCCLAVVIVLAGNIGGITLVLVAMFIWNAGKLELDNEKMMLHHSSSTSRP